MSDCTVCNLCDKPGTLANAADVAEVPCHVICFQDRFFTVWRCRNCGSLHSKQDVNLLEYYEHYPFRFHKPDMHTRKGYANRVRLLKKVGVKQTDRVLDYGCGQGLYLDILKDNGWRDVSGYDTFIERFASKSICEDTYDVVVSHDVIEHANDPRAMFEEITRCVKPNGLLVMGTPNADGLDISKGNKLAVELSQPYHRHIFSEKALVEMAADYGLVPVNIYRRFYFDTLFPSVNTRFMWEYINTTGGMIDICIQKLKMDVVLSSPKLIFYALFGYFFPPRSNILITFKKSAAPAKPAHSGPELKYAAGQ